MIAALETGYRLTKKLVDLNSKALLKRQEWRRRRHDSADYWNELPRALAEHAPVFVLSTGRCGTRLLTDLFELAPGVACHHSPQPELHYFAKLAYERGQEAPEQLTAAVHAARWELIADSVVRRRRYIETNQKITFLAPVLAEMFPRAVFVHLVRHPGAFVRSGVTRSYYQGSYSDLGRITPLAGKAADEWETMSSYGRTAWLWDETNRYVEDFKQTCGEGRVLTVKSEDLFRTPETTGVIFRHCQIDAPAMRRVASLISRPVNSNRARSTVPPYQEWSDSKRAEVRRWISEERSYGYEL